MAAFLNTGARNSGFQLQPNPAVNPPPDAVTPTVSKGLLPTRPLTPFDPINPASVLSPVVSGAAALLANQVQHLTSPSTQMSFTGQPATGSEGSAGLEGTMAPTASLWTMLGPGDPASAVLGGTTTPMAAVGTPTPNAQAVSALSAWQLSNPMLDVVGRIGLPIAAILAYRGGHTLAAGALALPAVALWYNRLKG